MTLAKYNGQFVGAAGRKGSGFSTVAEMVAFIEANGDTVIRRQDDHKGCSHLLTTESGYQLAYNGFVCKVAE